MRFRAGPADLAEGEMRGVRLPGDRRVLLAVVQGEVAALNDECNHAGCLLSGGSLYGSEVVCPCHGMTFDVRSGALTCHPRLCDDQRTYPAWVEGGEIWVEIG